MDADEGLYFAHLPKTGGVSVRSMLADWFDTAEILPSFVEDDLAGWSDEALAGYRYLGSHFTGTAFDRLAAASRRPWRIATFLREPAARTLSHLRHVQRVGDHVLQSRLRDLSPAACLADPEAVREFGDYQSRYLLRAVEGSAEPAGDAPAALARRIELVGLTEAMEASLLLFAHRLGHRPLAALRWKNVDPDRKSASRAPDPALLPVLREMNAGDEQLYIAGRERLLADFAALCDALGQAAVDPLVATGEQLARVRAAVARDVEARLRAAPGPRGWARLLRVIGGDAIDLAPTWEPGSGMIRRGVAPGQPLRFEFDRGAAPLAEIELTALLPHYARRWAPRLALDGAECRVTRIGAVRNVARFRASVPLRVPADRLFCLDLVLPARNFHEWGLNALLRVAVRLAG